MKLSPNLLISCSSFINLRVRTWVQCCRWGASGGTEEALVALLPPPPPVCCFSLASLPCLSLLVGLSLPSWSSFLALISGVLRMLVSLAVWQCLLALFFWFPLVPFNEPWWCFGSSVSRSCRRIRPIFRNRVAIIFIDLYLAADPPAQGRNSPFYNGSCAQIRPLLALMINLLVPQSPLRALQPQDEHNRAACAVSSSVHRVDLAPLKSTNSKHLSLD